MVNVTGNREIVTEKLYADTTLISMHFRLISLERILIRERSDNCYTFCYHYKQRTSANLESLLTKGRKKIFPHPRVKWEKPVKNLKSNLQKQT